MAALAGNSSLGSVLATGAVGASWRAGGGVDAVEDFAGVLGGAEAQPSKLSIADASANQGTSFVFIPVKLVETEPRILTPKARFHCSLLPGAESNTWVAGGRVVI